MPRPRSALVLAAALALAAGACAGGDDAVTVAEAPPEETATTDPPTVPPEATSAAVDPEVDQQTPPASAAPRVEGCVELEEAPDGVYAASDAGEVVVTSDGDRLALADVRPAEGWSVRKTSAKDDKVDVELRADRKVTFAAELDDDEVEIEVCDDD
jgi:glucose/arabinose dehydrogenase